MLCLPHPDEGEGGGGCKGQLPMASSACVLSHAWWEHPMGASQLPGDAMQGCTGPGACSDEGQGKGKPAKCCAGFIPPALLGGILSREGNVSLG